MADQRDALARRAQDPAPCSATAIRARAQTGQRDAQAFHETADGYHGVIIQLDDQHRAIICKDRIQWIVQVRRGTRHGQPRWTGRSYLTTRDALIAASHALCGPLAPNVQSALEALPQKPEAMR